MLKVGNSLFWVDVMSQLDLEGYYPDGKIPDGQGYGIRKKYNLKNITEKDVKEIVRNIALLYGADTDRINSVLQSIGLDSRYLSKPFITSTTSEAKRDAA